MNSVTPPTSAQVRALNCPGCGAPLIVRAMGRAVTIVCDHCHSLLDPNDPHLKILQQFKSATNEEPPLIPLGSRGKWKGTVYEVIGFQRRTAHADDVTFSWREYVLFSPYKGFRYFTEYNGHWNDSAPVNALPEKKGESIEYLGTKYRDFQAVTARTSFVLGEFPWQVRVDDSVRVTDYIAPPHMLSAEKTGNEVTWTLGEYTHGSDIWKAFGLAGKPPAAIGVYENQPSPMRASSGQIWRTFIVLSGLIIAIYVLHMMTGGAQVLQATYSYTPSDTEASFVTPTFDLKGRTSNVELSTATSVSNQWIYLNYTLINDDSGQAYDIGREVSYYSGVDSDGAWTEGSKLDDVVLSSVPPGRYYLRIEPETDPGIGSIKYTIAVRRDVVALELYWAALAALLVPALLLSWRAFNFEQLRWSESDHPKPSFFGGDQ
jgi:hypothetical protein